MYVELERIGERFGVRDSDMAEFIAEMSGLFYRHLRPVEDYHGKVPQRKGL